MGRPSWGRDSIDRMADEGYGVLWSCEQNVHQQVRGCWVSGGY